ncbi:MAG: glycosyltransferase family 4 protein [Bacteroidetes bacterium]|nr:glycosyltransferase family 4 protein [Bacteroidota bacterium]
MKILFIHNDYAKPSGEEHAAEGLANILTNKGHTINWYRRSSAEIGKAGINKFQAFFSGFYNRKSIRHIVQKINQFNPDIIQVQNLYPLISPAVLSEISKTGVPIVMRCPNYRIFCPNGLFLDTKGQVCEKCTGPLKETWCILKNCEWHLPKSIGYGLRNMYARLSSAFTGHVNAFIVQSEFQRDKFIQLGIAENRLHIIPGITPPLLASSEETLGEKVTFVGRASPEKGIYEFVEAAKHLPGIPFAVAGRIDEKCAGIINNSPSNIEWTGFISDEKLDELYINSRVIVIPSKWYEGFPNVITRAMIHGKPVITSNLGVMASIIDHQKNGLLTEPGNTEQLIAAIDELYKDKDRCKEMGQQGKKKAEGAYSDNIIYTRLMETYKATLSGLT